MTPVRHVVALLVGAAVALASLAAHRSLFPLGLLVALATTYAVPWWLLRSRHPRTAASYAVGWIAVLAVAVTGRPEGDYVSPSTVTLIRVIDISWRPRGGLARVRLP